MIFYAEIITIILSRHLIHQNTIDRNLLVYFEIKDVANNIIFVSFFKIS